MGPGRLAAIAAVVLLAAPVDAAALGCERGAACARPLHVPGDYRTVQSAIEAAPDGATIVLDPGVFDESFHVVGKQLRIMGSDEGRTVLTAGREDGIATYSDGGGGELKNVDFRGGAYAIGSPRDARSLPGSLAVKNVSISGAYRGVYGSFSELDLKNVVVSGTIWNGISITHVSDFLALVDVEVHDSGGVGVRLFNNGPGDMTVGGHFHHNAIAGVLASGNVGTVHLAFVVADHNGVVGVWLSQTTAGMALSSLEDQYAPEQYGCTGAGLLAIESVVTVAGTIFRDNCVAASNGGSFVGLTSNTFDSTTGLEQWRTECVWGVMGCDENGVGVEPVWDFQSSNVCGFHLGTQSESLVDCADWFLSSLPPAPPEMIGGLE